MPESGYPEKSRHKLEAVRQAQENDHWEKLPATIREEVTKVIAPFLDRTDVSSSQSFDHSLCTDASLDDLDFFKIRNFFKQEQFLKEKAHLLALSESEQLTKLGLIRDMHPTYGTLLCFGKDTQPQHWISSACTRCTEWSDTGRLDNRLFEGDLLSQFEASRTFLQSHLTSNQVITSNGSSIEYEITFRVLEEALTNALVHREYKGQHGFVQVQIFTNCVEISSPGALPDSTSIDAIGMDITSHPRNFQIALIFYLYGYIQEAGSGIPRMRQLWRRLSCLRRSSR